MATHIKIESETTGTGALAMPGDTVTVSYTLSLSRGEVVQSLDRCVFTLGRRQVIAALEYGVQGMRVGGHRRFRAGPHLGYREAGVEGIVPPNAVLVFDCELLSLTKQPA